MNLIISTKKLVDLALTAAELRMSTLMSTGIGAKINVSQLANVQVICRDTHCLLIEPRVVIAFTIAQ
ncbi:hypothetical protein PQX77_010256, partial [Marasmius sp. AFHP31]